MNEEEFKVQWESERAMYLAWAGYITSQISIYVNNSTSRSLVEFLKVPVKARAKETKSLIDKAFYRNKNYANPYFDITDKVGIRFVVLLTSEIKLIEEAIISNMAWTSSKDRDFEAEREKKPMEFAYQSVHFVVRSINEVVYDGVPIPPNTSCEIQIRTLLQHAHSELTHDSIYKPNRSPSPDVQRTVAKSMALIEAVDDFFVHVTTSLEAASKPMRDALATLALVFSDATGLSPELEETNQILLDAYPEIIDDTLETSLRAFLTEKSYVGDKIKERYDANHLYRQPAILIPYLLAGRKPVQTKKAWPFTEVELQPIYVDLGLSFDDH